MKKYNLTFLWKFESRERNPGEWSGKMYMYYLWVFIQLSNKIESRKLFYISFQLKFF